jgi:diguanylate cyclase (GGDEF)-like protein
VARLKSEFFLGGLVSGCAFIYSLIWVLNSNVQDIFSVQYEGLLVVAPLFLIIGILVHWFSKMENRVSYDPLLQIYNRDYCSKIISEQSKINSLPPFSIAMVDIDHFKNVNDTYGHQAGDAVLYEVAQAVSRGVAQAGVVCRYGGEELVVFSPQKTMKQLAEIIENVRIDIEKIKTPSGKKKISVTISAGVSQREHSTQTIMDVIQAADKALYKAKDGGRNQIKSGKITETRK